MRLRSKSQSLGKIAEAGFVPDLIVDIGAAAGTDGLYDTWPEASYILVEPLAKFRPALDAICKRLPSSTFRIALASAASGKVNIASHPHDPHTIGFFDSAPSGWITEDVEKVTVDELILNEEQRLGKPLDKVVLKIDVDGAELDVIAGSKATLERSTVVVIEAVLHDSPISRFSQIVSTLLGSGYNVFDIIEPIYRPSDDVLWQVDLVLVSDKTGLRRNFVYNQ